MNRFDDFSYQIEAQMAHPFDVLRDLERSVVEYESEINWHKQQIKYNRRQMAQARKALALMTKFQQTNPCLVKYESVSVNAHP